MKRRGSKKRGDVMRAQPSHTRLVARFGGDLLAGALLFLLLVIADGAATLLVNVLPLLIRDRVFQEFSFWMHVVLLACDGFLFIWAVLKLVVRAIKGGSI
jgi:hypothetical protein